MTVSKSQQRAVHKYVKANYDRLELTVPKGRKEIIRAAAEAQGTSINSYINTAVDEKMERDALPYEVIVGRAMDTLAEYCNVGKWDFVDEVSRIKEAAEKPVQATPEPKKRGRKRKATPPTGDMGTSGKAPESSE